MLKTNIQTCQSMLEKIVKNFKKQKALGRVTVFPLQALFVFSIDSSHTNRLYHGLKLTASKVGDTFYIAHAANQLQKLKNKKRLDV
jgi:hypothetical protein